MQAGQLPALTSVPPPPLRHGGIKHLPQLPLQMATVPVTYRKETALKILLPAAFMGLLAFPALAEEADPGLQARTAAFQAHMKPVTRAALVEWAAANCGDAISSSDAQAAGAVLTDFKDRDTISSVRKMNVERARILKAQGQDACQSALTSLRSM
jgi:hypothetical protein